MWKEIRSPVLRRNGTAVVSATETFQSGAQILQIRAFGSSTAGAIQIFSDPKPITIPASSGWLVIQENHTALTALGPAGGSTGTTIVFTGVASYSIEYVETPGSGGT